MRFVFLISCIVVGTVFTRAAVLSNKQCSRHLRVRNRVAGERTEEGMEKIEKKMERKKEKVFLKNQSGMKESTPRN